MHQRITIWRPDGIVENIEADQGYFKVPVNHVDGIEFDKNLAHIAPCTPAEFNFTPDDNTWCSLYLHPVEGFRWDREVLREEGDVPYFGEPEVDPTGWGSEFSNND